MAKQLISELMLDLGNVVTDFLIDAMIGSAKKSLRTLFSTWLRTLDNIDCSKEKEKQKEKGQRERQVEKMDRGRSREKGTKREVEKRG